MKFMKDIPQILLAKAGELEEKASKAYPALKPLVRQCFLNTIETTVKQKEDGSYFVITGDIPAMWLRDSVAQLTHYFPFSREDEQLRQILCSVIQTHAFYVNLYSYSHALNAADSGSNAGY